MGFLRCLILCPVLLLPVQAIGAAQADEGKAAAVSTIPEPAVALLGSLGLLVLLLRRRLH